MPPSPDGKLTRIPFIAVACAAGGAAAMYMLDPRAGRRRRKEALDRLGSLARHGVRRAVKLASHARDRTAGLLAVAVRRCCDRTTDDEVIQARVRSALGRVVSHPHAIRVRVRQGVALLDGPILSAEVARLLRTVRHVSGVGEVLNRLDVYDHAGQVVAWRDAPGKALKNPGRLFARSLARAAAGAVGGGLVLRGIRQRGRLGCALATAGTGLIASSLITRHRHPPQIEGEVDIGIPIEDVFDFFSNWASFRRFLPGVSDVRETRPGRLHWVGSVTEEAPIPWDADLIEFIPNRRISWNSVPGSPVEGRGSISFHHNGKGKTRVHVELVEKMAYGGEAPSCVCRERTQLSERLSAVRAQLEESRPTAGPARTAPVCT